MAVREVDESEFLNAQAVVAAVNKMMGDKDARKLLLQARKKSDPSAVIPELDAAEPVNAQVNEIRAMLAEEKAAREAEKAERAQAAQVAEFTKRTRCARRDGGMTGSTQSRRWRRTAVSPTSKPLPRCLKSCTRRPSRSSRTVMARGASSMATRKTTRSSSQ